MITDPGRSPRTATRTFAANLRRLREQRGWMQADLADRSGAHQTTISAVERGSSRPTLDTAAALAAALEASLDAMITPGGES